MTNDELIAAWRRKLPGVEPTERELSAFALGVEAGSALAAQPAQEAADGEVPNGLVLVSVATCEHPLIGRLEREPGHDDVWWLLGEHRCRSRAEVTRWMPLPPKWHPAWKECTAAAAADYQKQPTDDWVYETRALYTSPQPSAGPSGWIACSERMPEPGVEVLTLHVEYGRVIDVWDEQREAPVSWSTVTVPVGHGWNSGADPEEITHWMPLPAPPADGGGR